MEQFLPFLVVAIVIAGIGGFIYLGYLAERKRTEKIQLVARELEFEFFPEGNNLLLYRLETFQLFSHGRGKKICNVLRGTTNDLQVWLFDYRYTTGGGKNARTRLHTVFCCEFSGVQLPEFILHPKNLWHRIGIWLGNRDIPFESHPEFSRRHVLRGGNEAAVRHAFTSKVLDFFNQRADLNAQAFGGLLILYRATQRLPPERLRDFLQEGLQISEMFRAAMQ